MSKRFLHISGKARSKHILFRTKLMTRLTHYRIDYIQTGDLIFWFALEDEFLDILDDMFVELYRLHCCFRDRAHLRLANRDLEVVQRKELKRKIYVIRIVTSFVVIVYIVFLVITNYHLF